MKTVYKFPLVHADQQVIWMQEDATILSAHAQGETICVWALVESESPQVSRRFFIHGTGHEVISPDAKFIGTVLLYGAKLIFHVFDGGIV